MHAFTCFVLLTLLILKHTLISTSFKALQNLLYLSVQNGFFLIRVKTFTICCSIKLHTKPKFLVEIMIHDLYFQQIFYVL